MLGRWVREGRIVSATYVDVYIKNLPDYINRALISNADGPWRLEHNYFYRELLWDFDRERNPPTVKVGIDGEATPWVHIDFDPWEVWLGRQEKPLVKLRVETWECVSWMDRYPKNVRDIDC